MSSLGEEGKETACSCHSNSLEKDSCGCHGHSHEHTHEHNHKHGSCCNDDIELGAGIGCSCGCEENEELRKPKILIVASILFIIDLILGYYVEHNDNQLLSFLTNGQLVFICYLVTYLLSSYNVIIMALKNIKKLEIFDENFLMLIASIGAFLIQAYPEAVAVMIFYNVGEMVQDLAIDKSKRSISELMDIRPDEATLVKGDEETVVEPSIIEIDDILLVKAGEKIPVDGVVISGEANLDMRALTGESVPVRVAVGSEVISGGINTDSVLKIRATKTFSDSTVSKILKLVESSSLNKSKTEKFITRFAKIYTPIVVFLALALIVIPTMIFGFNTFDTWLYRGLTFLVTSCPCALVISIPLTYFAGIGGASSNGILIKGASFIDGLNKAKDIVFDKTGTLTKGEFKVLDCKAYDGDESDLLYKVYLIEKYSNHPIAKAFVNEVAIRNIDENYKESDYKVNIDKEISGKGIVAYINEIKYLVGNLGLMEDSKINIKDIVDGAIYVANDTEVLGYFIIGDDVRPFADKLVASLKSLGIEKTTMLTGDSKKVANKLFNELHIDEFYAQLLPQDKVNHIEQIMKDRGNGVIFVGDGINDAPVLARADVGIAMGGLGSDAAIEAADVVLMTDELEKLPLAIKIARRTMRIVKENILFILAIKLLVLILAGLGLVGMWVAVFADVGVALIAILNGMRALRIKN